MKKTTYNNLIKAGVVTTSVLLGIVLTGGKIALDNEEGINNALGIGASITGESRYKTIRELQDASKELSRTIESEGIVMLENKNNALPLKADAKVTLFGYTSVNPMYGGRGSSSSGSLDANVDMEMGLSQAGLQINPTIQAYLKECKASGISYKYSANDIPWGAEDADPSYVGARFIKDTPELLNAIPAYGDAAIYTISRTGGEAGDVEIEYNADGTVSKDDLALKGKEESILKGLGQLKKDGKIKKVIVLLNATNQIQQKALMNPDFGIDAILWIGHTGINGFEAVGDVLTGKVNPSGHLVDTFWYDHQDNPVMKNFGIYTYKDRENFNDVMPPKNSGTDPFGTYVAYQEGVYQGYRYAETRYTDVVNKVEGAGTFDYADTIYRPFGYGMSYTNFEFSDYNLVQRGNDYIAKVAVKNTGDVAGKAVAQVYVQKPYTEYDKTNGIEKPAVELAGFEKTKLLEPGETQTLAVPVDGKVFASYDRNKAKTYVITEGDYLITVAQDAHKAANNFLAYNGKKVVDGMTEDGDKNMVAKRHYDFDNTTYATSIATGNAITNLFDYSDINKTAARGDNKLEFLTRNNWDKVLSNELKLNADMVHEIKKQQTSDEIKPQAGDYPTYNKIYNPNGKKDDKGNEIPMQLVELLMDSHGNELAFDDPLWDKFLDQLTWEETVDLVTKGLRMTYGVERLGKPQTLDHNGPCGLTNPYSKGNGLAKKDPNLDKFLTPIMYPTVPVLGATFNKQLASDFGDMLGEDALWAGYSGFYGVALNAHRSPYGGRHFEYWSEDPLLAGQMAAEQVKTLQQHGVMAYIKHFALNDQESQRFGIQVWSNEQALREISLRPFEIAVVEGKAMSAMASFSRIGFEFAPASSALLEDFLRGELGMRGLVVTDMYSLGYNNDQYPYFLMNGTCIPDESISSSVFDKYKEGYPQVANKMRDAAQHVLYHALKSNAMNGKDANTILQKIVPAWKIGLFVGEGVIGTLFGASIIWAITNAILVNKDKIKKLIKK